ncbi:hypothetical protein JXI42_03170 [bacterium]|nr:hypothetical protein [bacterium]
MEEGKSRLDLLHTDGDRALSLSAVPGGGMINIFDSEKVSAVNLAAVGTSKLFSILNSDGSPAVMLSVSSDGHPGLILYGERERPSIVIYDDLGFKVWEKPD